MSGINVSIYVDAAKAIETFGKLKERTTDLEKGFNKIEKSFNKFGSLATKNLTVPIAAGTTAMALATKKAIDFDNGMRQVATMLPKLSKEGFGSLKQETLDFAKEIGKVPEEVIPALYNALSAGIPRENVFDFLRTASSGAIAGVSDLTTSVDGLSSVVNAYGSEVLNVNEASDIMFATLKLGKTDFTQIANTVSNVIPVASAIGVKFHDIGAAIAVMTAQGTPTAKATTQIRQALVELNKEGSIAYETFKSITGKTFREFIKKGGNLQEALNLMSETASYNKKEVTSLFSSVEAGNAVLSLSGKNAQKFKDALEEVKNSAGATSEAFQKIDDGPARRFERIKAEVDSLIIELGNSLLPVVEEKLLPAFKDTLIPTAEKLVIKISDLITAFRELPAPVQTAVVGFVGLAAGFGPALQGIISLKSGFVTATKTIKDFGKSVGLLKNYVGSIKALSGVWKALNTVIVASPIGIITAVTVGLGALAVKAYKTGQELRKLKEELNTNTYKNLGEFNTVNREAKDISKLFIEYNNLAKAKSLDEKQSERLNELTQEITELFPELKTKMIDGVNYIDNAKNKVENFTLETERALRDDTKKQLEEWAKIKEQAEFKLKEAERTYEGFGEGYKDTSDYKNTEKELTEATAKYEALSKAVTELNSNERYRHSLTVDGIDLKEKSNNVDSDAINLTKLETENTKNKTKTFKEYLEELKNAEEEEKRRVSNLRALGQEINDTEALETKKEKVCAILSEMSAALSMNSQQIKYLSDNYGYALDNIKGDKFSELVKEIEKSIEEYERGVEIAEEFGDKISDTEKASQKSEIVRKGIENIANEIELTSEQVEILKEKFEELYKTPSQNISEYFKSNLAQMLTDTIGYIGDMYSAISNIKINAIEIEMDRNEERKEAAIKAIEEEKNAKLKAIGIMENSEKQSLLKSIKQIKNRQKVALGLYEQERLQQELKEKEQALAKIEIEEEAKLKQAEIEKNYNNEKMRLEYNSKNESWKMSVSQATTSLAQAAISAISSAMAAGPFPYSLIAYATLLGIVASGAVQIAALQKSKPQEPKYLAKGGIVGRRAGGINAVIGEGPNDEAVIPLEDRILGKIGDKIFNAAKEEEDENKMENNNSYYQPIILKLDGRVVAQTILNISKRGVKVVSERGIL
ncbi:phage tail tape measure protein [Brachyspira aalborgi]|uniref:Phage tail tape measure protein n=1 Tax=Brachyspira aalborgi TaxID=29522 RepID=A0A5C8ES77_9SPIR|nr:phage tail tape measure protein [Brachyspira aalborgi]TXJ39040.1 phage tail tape measure protein [Brachyspira aalborgi]